MRAPLSKPVVFIAIFAFLFLEGCITSKLPLLDERSAVADPTLTGRYLLTDSAKESHPYDVYLKGAKYLIVQDQKIAYIGTLHRKDTETFLAQLRDTKRAGRSGGASDYSYMIVKKTTEGVNLNFIPCSNMDNCAVEDVDELRDLASLAERQPVDRQLAIATKIGELGQPPSSE